MVPIRSAPITALRRSFERARELSLSKQVQEAADQLGHPAVVADEVRVAFREIEEWCTGRELGPVRPPAHTRDKTLIFYPTREIAVIRGSFAFTCLGSRLDPLEGLHPEAGASDGLDYVGLTCDDSQTPVLGAVQCDMDTSAYPLLLRGLACLAEMAPSAQIERFNRSHFLEVLGEAPCFDVHLVLADHWLRDERMALEQLTRDLAEQLARTIREQPGLPSILRHIVCLRMNPERFDGRLRFEWRV